MATRQDAPSADDILGSGPPPASSDINAPQPIGVPSDYSAHRQDTSTEDDLAYRGGRPGSRQVTRTYETTIPPRYFEGADWLPAGLPPQRIADMQRAMIAAGLIPPNANIKLGFWDDTTRDAWRQVLTYANASGLTAEQALAQYGDSVGSGNAGRAPLTKQVTNIEDLRPAIRRAFIDTLGMGISQDQVDALAAQFQALQSGAQEQAYNMEEAGGTVTAPPSAENFAVAQARAQDPVGAETHDMLGTFNQFRDIIGKWSG